MTPTSPRKRAMVEPLEAAVQSAIRQYLAYHPKVAWHGRMNSGAAMLPSGKPGKFRPVKFHDVEGLSDIIGQLTDGRFLAIEVKRSSWTKPKDEREHRQARFLDSVNAANGLGFFARGVADVVEKLK